MNTSVDNTCSYMYISSSCEEEEPATQIGLHENSNNPYISENSISIISKDVTENQIIHEVLEPSLVAKQNNIPDYIDYDSILKTEFNSTHSEGFRCHICSFLLPSSRILRHHLVKIHSVLNTVSHFCPLCDHECWSEEQLNYHLNLHHGIKRAELACNICGVELSAKCEVKAHQRKHELSYSCYSCSQKFGAKHLLLLHTQDHIAKLKPYACCLCGKRFKHAKAYFLHEWRHSKQSCPESNCDKYFDDESYLLFHLQEKHKMNDQKLKELVNSKDELDRTIDFLLCLVLKDNIVKLIDLETCNEESYSTFSFIFDTEESDFHKRENWDCLKRKFYNKGDLNYDKICELKKQLEAIILDFNIKEEKSIFESEKELIELENLLYNKQSKYMCGLCNMSFSSFALYQNHAGTHRKSYKCHSCLKTFPSLKHLRRHASLHCIKGNHLISPEENHVIKCSECGKLFLSEKSLNHHKELSHKRAKRPKCKICQKPFSTKGNLNEHLNLFHKDSQLKRKKYYCSICDRGLISKENYTRHLRTHDIGPSLSCPKCSKKFVRALHLNRHIAEHDKTHCCNICGSVYSSLSKLAAHYSSHNEELKERFPCKFCKLTFPYNSQLKTHTLIHTGEKPYICEKCGKAFKRMQQCKVHSKLVHSDKNIQCTECLKFFGTEFNLTRHRFACHMNLKRWICGICGHSYGYSQDLRNHLHKIHSYDLKAIDYKSKKSRSEVYIIPELGSFEISCEAKIQIENLYQEESRKLKEFLSSKNTQSSKTEENSNFEQHPNLSIENVYPQPAVSHTYPVTIQIHPNHQFQTCVGNSSYPVLIPSESEGNVTEHFNQKLNTVYRSNLCNYCKTALSLNCKIFFCKECSLTFCSLEHVNAHITFTHGKLYQCSVCCSQFNSKEKCINHILEYHQIHNPPGQVIWLQPEVEFFPQSNISQLTCTPVWPSTNSVLQIVPGTNPQHISSLPVAEPECLVPNPVKPVYQVLPINPGIHIAGQSIDKVMHGNVSNNTSLFLIPNAKNSSSLTVLPTICQSENSENIKHKEESENILLSPNCLPNQQVIYNHSRIVETLGSKATLGSNVTDTEALDAPQVGASIEISSAVIPSTSSNYFITQNCDETKTEYSADGPSNPLRNILTEDPSFLGLNKSEYQNNEVKISEETSDSQQVKPLRINKSERNLKKSKGSPVNHNSSSKVFYKCRICEKLFESLAILERHNKIHNAKKFTCAICDKKFVEKFNLKTHMLTHTQEKPRECTHCSKKFRYYRDLKDHLRSHSGVLPFDCSTCGGKFRRARDLKRHIKEQHATKKYKCSECNKVFGRKYYLEKYHMKTHVKKVTKKSTASSTCNRCLKDFSLKEMANHSCKPVSPSKTFHCTKCGKTFQKKRSLSAHLRVHCENKR